MKKIALFLTMIMGCTAIAMAAPKKVAVYVDGDMSRSDKSIVNSSVVACISDNKNYRAYERNTTFVNTLDKEHDYQVSGEVSLDEIRPVGERMGVDYVIVVVAKRSGENCNMTARLIELASGEIIKSENIKTKYKNSSELKDISKKVAFRLLGDTVETFKVNGVSFDLIRVDGGSFTMGSYNGDADETPTHSETVETFYIGKTEVTQALWDAVMGSNPSKFRGSQLPVENVSWDDCQIFIKKLNELTKKCFRLPTEVEWEYAARGGKLSKNYKYSGSNSIGSVAWYNNNSKNRTHQVALKQPNEIGIYDMSGNVFEWTADYYRKNYNTHTPDRSLRVRRGGGWGYDASTCRVASRGSYYPDRGNDALGLRLAL